MYRAPELATALRHPLSARRIVISFFHICELGHLKTLFFGEKCPGAGIAPYPLDGLDPERGYLIQAAVILKAGENAEEGVGQLLPVVFFQGKRVSVLPQGKHFILFPDHTGQIAGETPRIIG